MGIGYVIKLHEQSNVCVFGLRGTGKDMLQGNVIARRKHKYYSNVDYGGEYEMFDFKSIDMSGNIYKNFIEGNIKPYKYPLEEGCDIYLSDLGIILPSSYCNELNRDYKYVATFMALSRQIANCSVHCNSQALNRIYDKVREQCDTFVLCLWIKTFKVFGKTLCIQRIRVYDRYESAMERREPLILDIPLFCSREQRINIKNELAKYRANYGSIKEKTLIYFNKSTYDTRIFKSILRGEYND